MKHVSARATACVTILFALVAMVPAWSAASAFQRDGVTVYLEVTDWVTGEPLTRACFIIEDASNEGCDENRDGLIRFRDVAPGSYNVIQTQGIDDYLPVGDFPILVNVHDAEQYFPIQIAQDTSTVDTADVAVRPFDVETNESVPGQCFIFHGGSLEGCDENGDGWVEFDDMPVGSYLLSHTQTTPGYALSPDEWFGITGDGYVRVPVGVEGEEITSDVSLLTRDPDTGEPLPWACYVIGDVSNEGCDENGDGQVDFEDVEVGVYSVRQTGAPEGYDETIAEFEINVEPLGPRQSIVVKQADKQNLAGHRNVSIVLYDTITGETIIGETCLEVAGESLEGCDDNRDGQVDFLDIPVGEHEIEFTNVPEGYVPAFETNTLEISPEHPFSYVIVYIGLTPGA